MLLIFPEGVRVDGLAPAVLDDVVAVPVGAVEALLVAAHPQRRVRPQPQRRHGQVRLEPAPAWKNRGANLVTIVPNQAQTGPLSPELGRHPLHHSLVGGALHQHGLVNL